MPKIDGTLLTLLVGGVLSTGLVVSGRARVGFAAQSGEIAPRWQTFRRLSPRF